jgi:hypothetical protein
LYGIGTIIGPLLGGVTMAYGPYLLFAVTPLPISRSPPTPYSEALCARRFRTRRTRNLCLDAFSPFRNARIDQSRSARNRIRRLIRGDQSVTRMSSTILPMCSPSSMR